MDDRDIIIIRQHVIDRAVALFDDGTPNDDGLFTTTNYIQAVGEAEFKTAGLALADCREHPSQMSDLIKGAGPSLWQRKEPLTQSGITESKISENVKQVIADPDTEEVAVTAAGSIIEKVIKEIAVMATKMTKLLEIQENLQDTYAAIAQHEKATAVDPSSYALRLSSKSLEKRRRKLETAFLKAASDLGVDARPSGGPP